jgi:hypothetical protein
MGTISKGILGGFTGKVGTVIGANWRGKDIMRSLPKKSGKPATEEQLSVRMKFKLISQFLAPLKKIISAYFGAAQGVKSRRNLAMSFHITEAVTGIYPNFVIDYTKVVITKGELANVEQPAAVPVAGAAIDFSWTDNSGQGLAKPDDTVLVAVCNPDRSLFEIREQAAVRTAGTYALQLPATWAGENVECWLSIASAEGEKVATSVYLGTLLLL